MRLDLFQGLESDMSFITVGSDGVVSASYDKSRLTEDDIKVLYYAVNVFSFLVKRNEKISLSEFRSRIESNYELKGRVKVCSDVLERSSTKVSFTCEYQYVDAQGSEQAGIDTVLTESWEDVRSILESKIGFRISSLKFWGGGGRQSYIVGKISMIPSTRDLVKKAGR